MNYYQCPNCTSIYHFQIKKDILNNMKKHRKFFKILYEEQKRIYGGDFKPIDQFCLCAFCGTSSKKFIRTNKFDIDHATIIRPIFFN